MANDRIGASEATITGSVDFAAGAHGAGASTGIEIQVRGDASEASDRGTLIVCRGRPFFLDADIELLRISSGAAAAWLALYRRVGVEAATRAHGRFAIVAVDQSPRRVYAAVDRFGTETLCWSITPGRCAFADRADRVPGHSRALDAQAIFEYLYFHMIPAPRTVFHDVMRLAPGHRLVIDSGRYTMEPYWQPVFEEHAHAPFASLREEFLGLLHRAVARAVDADPLGCYLSGGTDSSTVAGMICAVTGARARTYSIGFDVPGYDEMRYARIAARHFGTDHHEYYVTPADLLGYLEPLAAQFDQPFGNSSALPAYCCARMAREDGVARMLAGDGGDELFGGNVRYARQRLFAAYDALPAFLRRRVLEPLAGLPFAVDVPLVRKVARYIVQARVPMPERMEMYNLLRSMGAAEVFEPEFLARVDTSAPAESQRRIYDGVQAQSMINRMLAYDWKYTLADNDLPKVIGSARLAGIRVGFPLLDERLVEFSQRLPPSLKLRGFRLRWFFKAALADFLPQEILSKKKHGFGLPFGAWAVRDRALRSLVGDSLATLKRRQIVRAPFIDQLIERQLPEHPGYYGEMVWILMVLELWLQAHDTPHLSA